MVYLQRRGGGVKGYRRSLVGDHEALCEGRRRDARIQEGDLLEITKRFVREEGEMQGFGEEEQVFYISLDLI